MRATARRATRFDPRDGRRDSRFASKLTVWRGTEPVRRPRERHQQAGRAQLGLSHHRAPCSAAREKRAANDAAPAGGWLTGVQRVHNLAVDGACARRSGHTCGARARRRAARARGRTWVRVLNRVEIHLQVVSDPERGGAASAPQPAFSARCQNGPPEAKLPSAQHATGRTLQQLASADAAAAARAHNHLMSSALLTISMARRGGGRCERPRPAHSRTPLPLRVPRE
jgi:hypothetical protein